MLLKLKPGVVRKVPASWGRKIYQRDVRKMLPEPKPSSAYLRCVREGYDHVNQAGKQLVILDLNGTLVWRPRFERQYPRVRPGMADFTRYLLDNFHVMIWSSATKPSVTMMCDVLFSHEDQSQLLAIWTREKLGLTEAQSRQRIQTYKDLTRVWSSSVINSTRIFSQKNTIVLDDTPVKLMQHPHNVVVLPEYDEALHNSDKDRALSICIKYLDSLKDCSNVSAYIATNKIDWSEPAKLNRPAEENRKQQGGLFTRLQQSSADQS